VPSALPPVGSLVGVVVGGDVQCRVGRVCVQCARECNNLKCVVEFGDCALLVWTGFVSCVMGMVVVVFFVWVSSGFVLHLGFLVYFVLLYVFLFDVVFCFCGMFFVTFFFFFEVFSFCEFCLVFRMDLMSRIVIVFFVWVSSGFNLYFEFLVSFFGFRFLFFCCFFWRCFSLFVVSFLARLCLYF
jgi:hypothetical protein